MTYESFADETLIKIVEALEAAARRQEMTSAMWHSEQQADRRRFSDVPELITAQMPFGVR